MPTLRLDQKRRLSPAFSEDDTEPAADPTPEPDAASAALDPAPAPSIHPAYDTSRGDPLQYRGAMRSYFKDEVAGAQQAQNTKDALDRVTARTQQVQAERAARKAEADQIAASKLAEKTAKQDLNSAREGDFRTRGVSHFVDAHGDIQPDRNEDNSIKFVPKTGEITYDANGEAIRENRDEHGVKTTDQLDANAPIGTHPTRLGELYRQDKHSGWNYLSTVDEGLNNPDPSIRAAAQEAQKKAQEHLAAASTLGFNTVKNGISKEERDANVAFANATNQAKALDDRISVLRVHSEEKTGGIFGIGATLTPAAVEAKRQLDEINAQRGQLPLTPPNPKEFKAKRDAIKTSKEAFDGDVQTMGFDAAEDAMRQRLVDAGQDPEKDPVLTQIAKVRAEAGLTRNPADSLKKKPDEQALRDHPLFGPLMNERDSLTQEAQQRGDEVGKLAMGFDAKLDPMRQQFEQGQAQLQELSRQVDLHREQLSKALGKPIESGEDLSNALTNLTPEQFAAAQPILQSLSPIITEANRISLNLAPAAEQLKTGIDERNAAVKAKSDEVTAGVQEKQKALDTKWQAANEQDRTQRLPEAAQASVALSRQLPKLAGDDKKKAEDLIQQIEGNFAGTDFDQAKTQQEQTWTKAESLADLDTKTRQAGRQAAKDAAMAGMAGGESGSGALVGPGPVEAERNAREAMKPERDKMLAGLPVDEQQSLERKASTIRVERAMASAEQKLTAGDKLKDFAEHPEQFVGFIKSAPELMEVADVAAAAGRIAQAQKGGQAVSADDQELVATFAAKAGQKSDFWYKALDMLGAQPAFWQEFAATGGIYSAGKAVAEKAGMAALKKFISEGALKLVARTAEDSALKILGKGAASLAARTATSMVGSLPQTAVAGAPEVLKGMIERMAPKVGWKPNEAGELQTTIEKGQGAFQAAIRSFGDEYVQIFTEHSGKALDEMAGMIGGAAGKLFPKLGTAARQAVAQVALVKSWLAKHSGATAGDFAKALKKGGYDGVLEEMFEERVGNVAQAIGDTAAGVTFDKKKFADALGQAIKDNTPSLEQLGLEGATFGVPGLVSHVSNIRAEHKALDEFHGKQQEWLDHAEALRSVQPAEAISAALAHAPSDQAKALGAVDTSGLKEHLDAFDTKIADLNSQLKEAGSTKGGLFGGVDRQGRNDIAQELAQAHVDRNELLATADRSKSISEASDQIEKLPQTLTGATPEDIATTQTAAKAVLKIASGAPMDSLTSEEQAALDSPRSDGSKLPRVEMVKGQPVITDRTIKALNAIVPAAAGVIRQSEAERRQAILTKGGDQNGKSQTNEGQGRQEMLSPSGGGKSAPGALRALDPVENRRARVLAQALRNQGASPQLADRFAHGWVSSTGSTQPVAEQRAQMFSAFRKHGGALKADGENPNATALNEALLTKLQKVDQRRAKQGEKRSKGKLSSFEVQVDGEDSPRIVQAKTEADAKAQVAADPATKGFVRDAILVAEPVTGNPVTEASMGNPTDPETTSVVPTSSASHEVEKNNPPEDPAEAAFFEKAKADIERDLGKELPAKAAQALKEAVRHVLPAVQRWEKAFQSVEWRLSFDRPTGGAAVDTTEGKLFFSLADIVRERENYARGAGEHAVVEEAVHAVSERLHDEGKINLDAIWQDCPESLKAVVREAYKTGDDFQHSREFWRMFIQGRLNLGPDGWSVDGKAIVTEQVSPTFLQSIRKALAELFRAFSDIRKALQAAGAKEEYIAEVERARDLTLDRIKEIDAYGEKDVDQPAPAALADGDAPAPEAPNRSDSVAPTGAELPGEQPGADGGDQTGAVGSVRPAGDSGGTDSVSSGDGRGLGDSVEWSGERIALGGEWRSKNPRGPEVFRGRWALAPLRVLQVNTQHGAAQDRIDRERTGAAQRLEIINNVTPENVGIAWGESPSLSDGAPIVTSDGSVEVGNNRTLALREMLDRHPEKSALYQDWARNQATTLGLDSQAFAGEPVALVRVDDGSRGGLTQKEFVKASNTAGTEQRSVAETALADRALFVDGALLDSLDPNEDGSFNTQFLDAFYRAAGSPKELRFEDGAPDTGKIERRAQAALLAHLLGSEPGVDRILASLMDNIATPGIRQVISAIAKSGPALLSAEAINPALSVTANVGRALTALLDFRRAKDAGEVRTVADYRGQQSLFPGEERLPEELDGKILGLFADARSVKAVSDRFLRYAKAVQDYGHPDQGRFFQEDPPDPSGFFGTQPQARDSEREMLWSISEQDHASPPADQGTVAQWAAVYRKLFAIERTGQVLTRAQRALMDRAEQALGQRLLFGDEVRGTAPMAEFRLESEHQSAPPPTETQGTLFSQTQSPEFKEWFGESKVVDDSGEPLVVYHGTDREFDVFRQSGNFREGHGRQMEAIYFSPIRATAEAYARSAFFNANFPQEGKGHVIPAYLSLQNPKYFRDVEDFAKASKPELISEGHDGAIRQNRDGEPVEIAVFEPSQIKSSDRNIGDFDPRNPSIIATQPQSFDTTGLELFDRLTEGQQAVAMQLAEKLATYTDKEAAKADPEPTQAQKEAGNYQMGHARVAGLDVSIENAAGSIRSGEDKVGNKWSVVMGTHYGYIRGTEGKDGDHVDVMIKPGLPEDWSGTVYVVNQSGPDGKFDEHKAVLGANSEDEARQLYLSNYSQGWKAGPIVALSMDQFKEWLKTGDTKKPLKSPNAWVSTGSANELVKANLSRADAIAAGFKNIPGVEMDDIKQMARIGLFKAARAYDPASGLDFGPYAGTAIMNQLRRFYQNRIADPNIPTLDEPRSNGADDNTETAATRLPDGSADVVRDVGISDAGHLLTDLIGELPEHLRDILLGIRDGKTYEEIGSQRGVSKQAVGNLAKIALLRLRKKLSERGVHGVDDALLLAQPQAEGSPLDELMRMLDGDDLDPLSEKAAAEEPGSFTVGRPDLALGARDSEVRAVDEWMKGAYTPETRDAWRNEAESMLAADYAGTLDQLAKRALEGRALNPAETIAAQLLIDHELSLAQTPERSRRIQALTLAHRLTGRAAGRALAARVDMEQPPEARMRLFLNDVVNGTKPKLVKQIAEAKDAADAQKLIDQARAESERIKEELRKQGVSIDDLLSGEVSLRLKGAPIVQNIVKSFDEKRQQAFRLLQGGTKSFDEVAKETKLSPTEVEAVRDEFVAEFRRKHFEKFQKGAKAEQLDSGSLFAQPQSDADGVTDDQAEVEFQRALRMMGIVPKTDQGKFKVVKRRKRPRATAATTVTGSLPSFDRPVGEIPSTQSDLLKPERNSDRAPTAAERIGEAASKQNDLLNPERNQDRAPTGATKLSTPENKQGDLLNPERNVDRAPTGATPIGIDSGKQAKLDLPFEEWMYRSELDDAAQVARIAGIAHAANGGALDMAQEYWINSILSGPATHVANIAGNFASTAWDYSVQRGMEAMLNAVYRDADSAQFGEFKHILRGLLPGISQGLRLAVKAWNAEADLFKSAVLDQQVELFDNFEKSGGVKPAIAGGVGRVVRMPGRALLFMDSLFKRTIGQMEAGAQAYRMARKEGLKGAAMEARIRQLVNTPGSEAWQRAVEKAIELTFQQQSAIGELIGGVKSKTDSEKMGARVWARIMAFLFPFVNTPWNIFKIGVRKSPIGALNMLGRFSHAGFVRIRDGKAIATTYPAGDQIKHISEQVLGWLAMAALMAAAEGDPDDDQKLFLITGSMPLNETSSGERALKQRAFGGSYQIRIGGRRGTTINYGRYEPAATVLGTTVDMIRAFKRRQPLTDQLDAFFSYFVAQAQAKTFLKSQADMLKALQDAKGISDVAKRLIIVSLVPNLIRQPLRNLDEWQRDERGGGLKYQMLPLPGNAPQKIDEYGDSIKRDGSVLSRLFFPSSTETPEQLQAADALLLRWNALHPTEKWAPTALDRHYKAGKETKEMTGDQYEKLKRLAGGKVKAALANRISQHQIEHPTEDDLKLIKHAFETAHSHAREEMFPKQGAVSVRDVLWR